jgi:pilus assembly protein FimV
MKSAVRRVLLLSALMSPNALYALGLGEIHLHSALNQPFDADIDLVSAADEDLSTLRASLAPNDVFARYGIDKPAFLADFTFRVVRGADGKDYLKVTSPRPVTEPFVTMLVAADWPRGRLLREYTVLLDPPVFAPAPEAGEPSVAAPRVQASPATPRPAPEPRPEPAPASASPRAATPERTTASRPMIAAGSDYRVRQNDTLWKIASEAHPGSRSDVNRAMVAIYQASPHAFDGNINVLRAGSTLHIPDASAVAAIPASAAAAEVSRQYHLWRDGTASAESSDAAGGRLRLVAPEQGTAAPSTATTTTTPATPGAPAAGTSSSQLQSRVQQLEAELADARRLLEVKNAELATLQGQTAAGQPGAAAPATPAGAVPVPGAEAPAAGAPTGEGAAPPAEVQPAPAPQPVPEAKKPPPQPAAEEGPSLTERLAGYWWVLLGLLAAALAFVLFRRSRGESGAKEMDLQEALARTRTDLRARGTPARDTTIVVEERRPTEAAAPRSASAQRAPEPTRRTGVVDETISGEEPVSVESGDPLAEADFHMAYGLYDQAADLVQLAIKRAPQRRDLKLKLLEIFFVWGNRDRFLELAREMNASRADAQPGEWDKILIMGKQIAPEDAIFAEARPQASHLDMELHSSAGPMDMDLGADHGSALDVDFPAGGPKGGGDGGGLDFEVSEPSSDALAPTVETPRIKATAGAAEDPTQEVAIEDLGLDVGNFRSVGGADGPDDTLEMRREYAVEDTVESPRIEKQTPASDEDDDLLSATGIMKEQTGILRALDTTGEIPTIEYGDATGELPTIQAPKLGSGSITEVDFQLGDEPLTMSEVGTKLDLARAYVDMGDPEGARSILDEVLKEGTADQKQEAERLMASLP